MEMNDDLHQLLQKIQERYAVEDQPIESYMEGLLYTEYLDYWDYINLDALLALQHPKTYVKDEMIFIIYHQITELYFKLSLWEYNQILDTPDPSPAFLVERVKRIINYFTNLTHSFDIMVDGMEQAQFLKFRLSLLPASGFQSAQYRMIEIASTDLINLVFPAEREKVHEGSIEDQYQYIYWKYGATVAQTGKKTLTLKRFEEKYKDTLLNWAKAHEHKNLATVYRNLPSEAKQDPKLIEAFKELDTLVNVHWPLVHFKSAVRYLKPDTSQTVAATGGTNWEKYLPPRFQRRVFFPELWSAEELSEWGIKGSGARPQASEL